jgi:hypothetical protein
MHRTGEAREGRREGQTRRRTVHAAPTAQTLTAMYVRGTAPERSARTAGVHPHRARARREVGRETRGPGVRGVVVRFGARLEHEDAQVRVRCREAASDDATGGAAY